MKKIAMLFSLMISMSSLFAQAEFQSNIASGPTGEAVTAWGVQGTTGVRVSEYKIGAWSPYTIVPGSDEFNPKSILVEMDRIGNCILAWTTDSGRVCSSIRLIGENWTTTVILTPSSDRCSEPSLTLDRAGTATLLWRNKQLGMQTSRLYSGTVTWSAPETISD
jgi:hypothetical protein